MAQAQAQKQAAWFRAEPIKPGPFNRFVVCRKAHDGNIIMHNGRYFIQRLTAEEARAQYRITAIVPRHLQEFTENEYH